MKLKRLVALLCIATGPVVAAPSADVPPFNAFLDSSIEQPVASPTRGLVAHVERRLGVPTFYWADRSPKERDSLRGLGLTPVAAARRHLFENAALYRQSGATLAESIVSGVHDTGRGAIIVAFRKEVDGVRVFRDELKVIMDRDLELVALAGYLPPHSATEVRGEPRTFRLGHGAAMAAALFDLTGVALEENQLRDAGPVIADYHQFLPTTGAVRLVDPARVRKVLFTLPDGLEPAYYVELDVAGDDARNAGYVVSAVDGRVLFRKNHTAHANFTYRVWADANGMPWDGPQGTGDSPHPTGFTDGSVPGTVPQQLVTLAHGPISTQDPWLAAGATETRGNNVDAYADLASPDGFGSGDLRAQVTSANTFDYGYDFGLAPNGNNTQIAAAVTQLFFDNNFFHDWYYDVGFDEAAGNGQQNNFGRGGIGGDPVRVEAQDYSGTSNANMYTPADGARPRMQMYIFQSRGAQRVYLTTAGGQSADYFANVATFGPTAFDVAGTLVLANDGTATGPNDGCEPLVNAAQIAGNVALIERGICTFATKVKHAQNAGAIGVIITNNQSGFPPTLSGTDPSITIPALSVSQNSGNALRPHVGTGSVRLRRDPVVEKDGTLDNAIVAHEWGHYISNRLIGDANGLDNLQGYGLGEGWGDFHGLLIVVREEDRLKSGNANYQGVYALSTWATSTGPGDALYFGIRRLPYSTDFTKNALTFRHIQDGVSLPPNVPTAGGTNGAYNSESHNTGEVWATMLWECYAALLNDSRFTFAEAQQRMREYLVAGYKGTPNSPTFLEARDAILAAAYADGPQDFVLLADAFARRGAGQRAVAPDRASPNNSPVVEDFTSGNQLHFVEGTLDDSVETCNSDGELDNGETGRLVISVRNAGITALTATTARVTSSTPGVTVANDGAIAFGTIAPFGTAAGSVEVSLAGVAEVADLRLKVSFTDPSLGASNVPAPVELAFRGNAVEVPMASTIDDVESSDSVWTLDAWGETDKTWRRRALTPVEHVWFGPNADTTSALSLVSPWLEASADQPLEITLRHRYDFEADAENFYDGAVIELREENGAWQDLGAVAQPGYNGTIASGRSSNPLAGMNAFVGRNPSYPAFEQVRIALDTAYAGKLVQLRFRIGSDQAVAATGWFVDDIGFSGIVGTPFPKVVPQRDVCGNASPVAQVKPRMSVLEGTVVTMDGTATDADDPVEALTWLWTQIDGPEVGVSTTVAPTITFTAPEVDADVLIRFQLDVSDGKGFAEPVVQEVLVRDAATMPVAKVTAPASVKPGKGVVLNGTESSDPNGDLLTFIWTQTGGPTVELANPTSATPSFFAPDAVGQVLSFELVVSDGVGESQPASVQIAIIAPEVAAQGCGCEAGAGAGLFPLWGLLAAGLTLARRRRTRP